jgi:hypothetical protein
MKIIRDDAEALVWQNKSILRPLAVVPVLFVMVILLGAFIQTLTHAPASVVFVLFILGGLALLFYKVATSHTFVFARDSRRFMVMRKYLARQTREEFEFDQVSHVQLKPGPHGINTLFIVLDSGKKVFVECYQRGRLKRMRADTVLLCETLGMPEPVFRKTVGEHVQALYQRITG